MKRIHAKLKTDAEKAEKATYGFGTAFVGGGVSGIIAGKVALGFGFLGLAIVVIGGGAYLVWNWATSADDVAERVAETELTLSALRAQQNKRGAG